MSDYKPPSKFRTDRFIKPRDQIISGKTLSYTDQNGDVYPVQQWDMLFGTNYKGQGPKAYMSVDPYHGKSTNQQNFDKTVNQGLKDLQDPQLPIHKKTALKKIRYKYKGK